MTNGMNHLPEDFFRTRPQRDELHRFLSEMPTQDISLVTEEIPGASEETASASAKKEPLLHIPHPTPTQKATRPIMLHIPHRITASRLSRQVHLTESGKESATAISSLPVSLVRQIKLNGTSSFPVGIPTISKKATAKKIALPTLILLLSAKSARKTAAIAQIPDFSKPFFSGKQIHLPLSIPSSLKRFSPINKRQSSSLLVLATPLRREQRAYSSLHIPKITIKLPGIRKFDAYKVDQIARILPKTRRMTRHFLPARMNTGTGQLYRALTLPVVVSRRETAIPRKPTAASALPQVRKRTLADGTRLAMLALPIPSRKRFSGRKVPSAVLPLSVPSKFSAQKARMPIERIVLMSFYRDGVRRVMPLFLPTTKLRIASRKAMPLTAISELPKVPDSTRIPVFVDRPAKSSELAIAHSLPSQPTQSIFKNFDAVAPQAPAPVPVPTKEERERISQAAFQQIISGARGRVKNLSQFRKPVREEKAPVLAIPLQKSKIQETKTPHQHTAPLPKRFALPKRPQVSEAEKLTRKAKRSKFLGEITRFAMTSAVIFALSFSVMNAPALSQLLMAKMNPEEIAVKEMALEKATDREVKNLAPILPTAGMKRESHKVYPPLRIKPAPLENRIVIPKIGKNIPIVDVPGDALLRSDWGQLEKDIQGALKGGVVHYPGTAEPGQLGNVFVTGHSSYYLWDGGAFKDVFARLHDLDVGDEFTIFWKQNIYRYKVRERKVVSPEETSVLKQPQDEKIVTLMTCTPIGTAKNRLILVAEEL